MPRVVGVKLAVVGAEDVRADLRRVSLPSFHQPNGGTTDSFFVWRNSLCGKESGHNIMIGKGVSQKAELEPYPNKCDKDFEGRREGGKT